MKKFSWLPAAWLFLFVLIGCVEDKKMRVPDWRFAHEEVQGGIQDAYAKKFKALLEEALKSSINIKIYPYGTLGTSDQVTELLATGALQFAMASPGHLGKMIPELQIFSLPFLFSENMSVNKEVLSDPQVIQKFQSLYREKGFKLLSIYSEGWQVWTANKKISQPLDFADQKIRVMTTPILLSVFKSYGANPTPLPYSEVYGALQLGMIDGQVNPVFAIEDMKFYEVNDYLIFPKATPFITTFTTSHRFFKNLDKGQQQKIKSTASELQNFIFDKQEEFNSLRLKKIKKQKPALKTYRLTPKEREAFKNKSKDAVKTYLKIGGKKAKSILKLIREKVKEKEEAHGI